MIADISMSSRPAACTRIAPPGSSARAALRGRGDDGEALASEPASPGADRGIQILGGTGTPMEYDMQRYWRDVRLFRIGPITNEMARNFIGESLGLPRSF